MLLPLGVLLPLCRVAPSDAVNARYGLPVGYQWATSGLPVGYQWATSAIGAFASLMLILLCNACGTLQGWVESRLRHLILKLEALLLGRGLAHPFPDAFYSPDTQARAPCRIGRTRRQSVSRPPRVRAHAHAARTACCPHVPARGAMRAAIVARASCPRAFAFASAYPTYSLGAYPVPPRTLGTPSLRTLCTPWVLLGCQTRVPRRTYPGYPSEYRGPFACEARRLVRAACCMRCARCLVRVQAGTCHSSFFVGLRFFKQLPGASVTFDQRHNRDRAIDLGPAVEDFCNQVRAPCTPRRPHRC